MPSIHVWIHPYNGGENNNEHIFDVSFNQTMLTIPYPLLLYLHSTEYLQVKCVESYCRYKKKWELLWRKKRCMLLNAMSQVRKQLFDCNYISYAI